MVVQPNKSASSEAVPSGRPKEISRDKCIPGFAPLMPVQRGTACRAGIGHASADLHIGEWRIPGMLAWLVPAILPENCFELLQAAQVQGPVAAPPAATLRLLNIG
jgi:hypothetical protein